MGKIQKERKLQLSFQFYLHLYLLLCFQYTEMIWGVPQETDQVIQSAEFESFKEI